MGVGGLKHVNLGVITFLTAVIYLWLPHKDPMVLFAGEVAFALHRAIILALGLAQDDSHPFPWGEKCGPDVGHCAALLLPYHLHQGAHFDGPPAPIWAHPAAATAGGLEGQKNTDLPLKLNTLYETLI